MFFRRGVYIGAPLGIFPYAPLKLLFVDPHLPAWLPQMRTSNFRIGQAVTAIRFYRKETGEPDYEVTELERKLRVIRRQNPWSLTATAGKSHNAAELLAALDAESEEDNEEG